MLLCFCQILRRKCDLVSKTPTFSLRRSGLQYRPVEYRGYPRETGTLPFFAPLSGFSLTFRAGSVTWEFLQAGRWRQAALTQVVLDSFVQELGSSTGSARSDLCLAREAVDGPLEMVQAVSFDVLVVVAAFGLSILMAIHGLQKHQRMGHTNKIGMVATAP